MLPELQLHTFDISHRISEREAKCIEQKYQNINIITEKCTTTKTIIETKTNGIERFEIKECKLYNEKREYQKTTYTLHMIGINLGKLLGMSSIRMTSMNQRNREKMKTALNNIMKKTLKLHEQNCEVETWTLNRMDCGIDIILSNPTMVKCYIRLLNYSLDLYNNRKCKLIPYQNCHQPQKQYESVYFGNNCYTYNIYDKCNEISKRAIPLSQKQQALKEAQGILRIEKQIKKITTIIEKTNQKNYHRNKKNKKTLALLFDQDTINKVSSTIFEELNIFFGESDFVSSEKAHKIIFDSPYPDSYKNKLWNMIYYCSNRGFQQIMKTYLDECNTKEEKRKIINLVKKYRKDLEKLGISVSGILLNEVKVLKIDTLQGLTHLLKSKNHEKPKKRAKSRFGKIYFCEKEGRYHCNFTLHDATGSSFRIYKAAPNENVLEEIILKTIVDNHNKNLSLTNNNVPITVNVMKTDQKDLENFKTTIKRPEMLKEINIILKKFDIAYKDFIKTYTLF